MPLPSQTPLSLASFKSILFLPFWYRLTGVVQKKRPLNGCGVVVVCWWSNINESLNYIEDLFTVWNDVRFDLPPWDVQFQCAGKIRILMPRLYLTGVVLAGRLGGIWRAVHQSTRHWSNWCKCTPALRCVGSKFWPIVFVRLRSLPTYLLCSEPNYLQCIDAVGWAAGRASGL